MPDRPPTLTLRAAIHPDVPAAPCACGNDDPDRMFCHTEDGAFVGVRCGDCQTVSRFEDTP